MDLRSKDGSLIDENDNVVIENIDDVIYTMSNYIVIHNDQGYLSYDTKTKTSVNLEYNDVVLVAKKRRDNNVLFRAESRWNMVFK